MLRKLLSYWRARCPVVRAIEKWRLERKKNKFEVKKKFS
ncbi:MAG: hypothetical protein PWP49_1929 [Thermococcaceae archaeon]|jgi:hypothetical protein|nr:MAG: Uncharacterized protein XD43_1910 [Thermococcales archaeon 44_46]MDK2854275.1 hypothetical protein [Thermococcaceae archaeon]MDN5321509.1 hypothetical protein [Thermococcaceae archaeon]